ncbi:leucine-rich repeat-containing protein 25-like [Pelodiscus sinensis]|uniref:leucine-rich repeat-containing protein 25-like n=1 Tax=Pelodiscus sinensis TaxID=13735 RepID=UPI003F6D872B
MLALLAALLALHGVAGSMVQNCTCEPENCTAPPCLCLSPRDQRIINVTEFHAQECRGLGTLGFVAIAASVLAVLLLAGGLGGVFVLLRRKRKASEDHGKRESTASIGHGQPRYISRSAEPGPGQGSCQVGDYENIFIGPSQPAGQYECLERRAPQYRVPDEDCYMESDACHGDLPIYCNTQQLYDGSYPAPHDPEDVYIVPDT